ncbi:hypothetical protein MTP99_012698 [Tenebrio molitor]|uniref:uncharacterized protein n=1 Tax=Tenebrio molitor TaxID=7067 RepID=UPI001C3B47DE|nr:hypothetical protein MTP99_012698 [Tenebrio molitor]CAH1371212.1 unnamed protein product [Tenebrio molitor]
MNNMTGDPNQENRPSVFGFEPYPSLNVQPIDWSRIPYESAPVPLIPSGQFNPSLSYQQTQVGLGNFSFCAAQAPHPVQFPFPTSPSVENAFTATPSTAMRCKRKTDSPTLQICKQHITEEKMAEHMARLHISSETATSSKESENDRTRRLYMCEEMRKLQSDSILPQSLLSKIQRPCTALVLWTPPRRLVPVQRHQSENGNNNEEAAPDNNRMASEVVMESDINNMDLDNI